MGARTAFRITGLTGRHAAPGDKSISHRSLMLGGLAVGETRISGMLEGEDVLATGRAMRALGAEITRGDDGVWSVHGTGVGGLAAPSDVLDLANAGTGVRLLMGVVATHPFTTVFTGDASLRKRPMERVMAPLRQMGARFTAAEGGRLPLTVEGASTALPIRYALPVPSAQVKSAIMLAGLNAPGKTIVIEREPTRDHTENMLRHFGASVSVEHGPEGDVITLDGYPDLRGRALVVPGDPSSAAFPLVAALITEGSELTVTGLSVNPLRAGLFDTLIEMGASLEITNRRVEGGEPVADITARSSTLRGVDVPAERAPSMIDEYPVLAIAAAFAQGRTTMRGLGELRVKESDRISAMARGLAANGVTVEELEDGMIVDGRPGDVPGGGTVETFMDHRIAMSFLVMGCASRNPVTVDEDEMIATSFPNFSGLMASAGARLEPAA
ncbi:3-phosphoshikimate 1-carboxyvinyltransferase [Iodidimonas sp. SYSU 1G8]|uniref:3-phosphoshikimate 1-carboxyvinyltransferase n=1 Tax=Iodidimonas sp. SYSU 1G8 TaxID=3133967 RepID=UPI0031FE5B38